MLKTIICSHQYTYSKFCASYLLIICVAQDTSTFSLSTAIIGGTVALVVIVLALAATVVIVVWLYFKHRMAVVSLQKGIR